MANTRPTFLRNLFLKAALSGRATKTPEYLQRLKYEHLLVEAAERKLLAQEMKEVDEVNANETGYLGDHLIADFECTDAFHKIVDECTDKRKFFNDLVRRAADEAKAHIITSMTFQHFKSGNISGLVVIEESHFTIHYVKEKNIIFVDAYTCGDIQLNAGVKIIGEAFGNVDAFDIANFRRGLYNKADHKLLLGIASLEEKGKVSKFTFLKHELPEVKSVAEHFLSEFYLCNPGRVNRKNFVLEAFEESITEAGGIIDKDFAHEFQPQGISAVLLGDGYHLTIHDWPEFLKQINGAYASLDLLNFNDKIDAALVIKQLQEKFQAEKVATYVIPRGVFAEDGKHFKKSFASLIPARP